MRNPRLLIIFFVVLVDMLSFSIVLPLLPYLAGDLGATAAQIGLLTAMYPLAQVFAAPLLGRMSDRYGRKPVLVLSILGTAVGFVVLATARWLPILFVSRLVDGITGGNISVAQAYIADVTDEKSRGQALGLIGAAFGLGFILGPVTGGLLSEFSYAAPAWVGAALAVLNAVAVLAFVPESLSASVRRRLAARSVRKILDLGALRTALSHHRIGPLLTVRTATGLSYAIFETSFALWAIASLDLAPRQNGLILGYVGVLSVIIQLLVIRRLTERFSDDGILLASTGIAGVALVAWGFTPNIWALIALMPALSFGLAVSNTIMTSALTKAVARDDVGSILGLQTSIMSFTRVPAPVIAGALLQYGPVWSPGLLAGLIAGGTLPYAYSKLCWRPSASACDLEPESSGTPQPRPDAARPPDRP